MTLTWLLLAAALALAGPAHGPTMRPDGPRARRALAPRTLQCCCGAAVAAACIAVLGPAHGTPIALVAGALAAVSVARLPTGSRQPRGGASLALTLDLVAVALHSGQSLAVALTVAAPSADRESALRLDEVGGLLRLGAEPAQAWRAVQHDPLLAPVAAAAVRSADSGVRLATAFEQLAADVRAELRTVAEARAHRVGVLVAAPLGLCFLPAFVCLGIVPIVVGVAGAALSGG